MGSRRLEDTSTCTIPCALSQPRADLRALRDTELDAELVALADTIADTIADARAYDTTDARANDNADLWALRDAERVALADTIADTVADARAYDATDARANDLTSSDEPTHSDDQRLGMSGVVCRCDR